MSNPFVVVIGAGPVGLAAAAHLLERGLEPILLEAATQVAASVRDWGHVRLFSPWRHNIDKAAARLLEPTGWKSPAPDELPTGEELYRKYLLPLSEVPAIHQRIRFGRRVTAITRVRLDKVRTKDRAQVPFLVRTVDTAGIEDDIVAGAVIDASGTWQSPNPLGASGLPAIGEPSLHQHVRYGIPDVLGRERARFAGKVTLVVGAGHSAANALLALAELTKTAPTTQIYWSTRGEDLTRVLGGGDADGLPARGKLGLELQSLIDAKRLVMVRGFRIDRLSRIAGALEVSGVKGNEPLTLRGIDVIVAATGQRPDLSVEREVRLSLDPALESAAALGPLIDPNEHSCGTVRPHGAAELAHPEPNFYIVGSKSYGRAPTFLLATGYEQVRSVSAHLAGDTEAAARVELELPKTGVCRSKVSGPTEASCCSPAKPVSVESSPNAAGGGCC